MGDLQELSFTSQFFYNMYCNNDAAKKGVLLEGWSYMSTHLHDGFTLHVAL